MKTHEENRRKVCVLCFEKVKEMRVLNSSQIGIIKKHVLKEFQFEDPRFPCSLCGTCRIVIQEYDKGCFKRKIQLVDYSKVDIRPGVTTRGNPVCGCKLCEGAMSTLHSHLFKSKKMGRPSKGAQNIIIHKKKTTKICRHCLTVIARGKSHVCTKGRKYLNALAMTGSPKSQEKIASIVLKYKQEYTTGQNMPLATNIGRPICVQLKAKTEPVKKIPELSAQQLSRIQSSLNLSISKTTKLAVQLRKATGTKIVESNIKIKLRETYHSLDEFFETAEIGYVEEVGHKLTSTNTKPTVFCNNVQDFINHVIQNRECSADVTIKIGIDGGGGFLKICLSLHENQKEENSGRKMKDSGVKKLFIIGIVAGVQKNYKNVDKLWNLLQLNKIVKFYVATDLKLANILTGIMAHSSLYPCTWCNTDKYHLIENGTLKTFESNTENYNKWFVSGGKRSDLRKFTNCLFSPIIHPISRNTVILTKIPPPELHLMMGAVNTIYTAMLKEFPDICKKWTKICHVQREALHGGSFNGNSCRLLLSKVDVLRSICPIDCLKYVKCLASFELVVISCFGYKLLTNFENKIEQFKKDFSALGINVTPKIHAIFYHISQFCVTEGCGLGKFSEQASEAVHAEFKKIWERYKVAENKKF